MTRAALLLAILAAAAAAGEIDADTLKGMNAEVQEDWVRATEAFQRAAAAAPGDTQRGLRLRHARQRGLEFWKGQLDLLIKERRFAEAAKAVALAERIDAKNTAVAAARRKVEQAGAAVPAFPADGPKCRLFPRRTPEGRFRCFSTLGAPFGKAEKLIDDGTRFLLSTQEKKGNWDAEKHGGLAYHGGVTAIALLSILTDGPLALEGERGEAVRNAVAYLVEAQDEDGSFESTYATMLAATALAEYAAIAGETERLRPTLERLRDYIVHAQNPGAGWRYKPRDGETDTSVTSRAVHALHRLRLAGIAVPNTAFKDALAWVDSMTEPRFGQIGYNQQGGASARPKEMVERFPVEHTAAMTAAGALVLVYAPIEPRDLSVTIWRILDVPPVRRYPDMYYWQVGGAALAADLGTIPAKWYEALVDASASCAKGDGGMAACDPWGPDGGRIYATGMTVLALAAPYSEPGWPDGNAEWATWFRNKGRLETYHAADLPETETGLYVDPTITLEFSVSGTLLAWPGSPRIGADGIKHDIKAYKPILKGEPFACLLGRVGREGKPFRIEDGKPVTFKTPGELFLLANDDRPEDGEDGWKIRIRIVPK